MIQLLNCQELLQDNAAINTTINIVCMFDSPPSPSTGQMEASQAMCSQFTLIYKS